MKKPKGQEIVKVNFRFPASLYKMLIGEAGDRTAKAGVRVSVNQLVVEILQRHVERRG